MKGNDYQGVCWNVNSGETKLVRNRATNEIGKIHSCGESDFRVYVGSELRTWARKVCEEYEAAE